MRRAYYLVALAAIATVALPACGGETQPKSALATEIKAAVRNSPQTYFAFSNPLYWGRPVRITIDRIRISSKDDHFAAARIRVLEVNGKSTPFPQQVLLRRSGRWQVADVEGGGEILCRLASTGVVRELFGRCETSSPPSDVGLIKGPLANRPPSATERALIIAATQAFHTGGFDDSCTRFHVRVSRVDDRFAVVGYTFVRPYTKCILGNGESWMERTSSGHWRVKGDGSDAPDCRWVPPGVARSLASVCNIARDWPYRKRT